MMIPAIVGQDHVHTRALALTWQGQQSVRPSLIQASAMKLLGTLLDTYPTHTLTVDCSGVSDVQDHALDDLRALLREKKRSVVFFGADQIEEEVSSQGGMHTSHPAAGTLVFGQETSESERLIEVARRMEEEFVREAVAKSFQAFSKPRRTTSTSLVAPGIFDSRHLLGEPRVFPWIALQMYDRFRAFINRRPSVGNDGMLRPLRLLAVSMRASALAGAIAILADADYPLEIVDHVGPRQRILEGHTLDRESTAIDYALIVDFVVGGTEIRMARTYAAVHAAQVPLVLAVGTYLDSAEYDLGCEVERLIQLRTAVPTLSYTF